MTLRSTDPSSRDAWQHVEVWRRARTRFYVECGIYVIVAACVWGAPLLYFGLPVSRALSLPGLLAAGTLLGPVVLATWVWRAAFPHPGSRRSARRSRSLSGVHEVEEKAMRQHFARDADQHR